LGVYRALLSARHGDPHGLQELLEHARILLVHLVRRRLSDGWARDWADDVVQAGLLQILRAHTTCRADSEPEVVGWIMAIGRRQVADLFRTRPAPEYPLSEDAAESAEPPHVSEHPEAAVLRRLEAVLSTLTPEQNRLLWYRIVGGWTWAELGQELEIPRTAAKRRYQRLVRRLSRAGRDAKGSSAEA
jgi:RNA polymerase sigma factor (sigma-70 family)